MNLLLDTCDFLWFVTADPKLSVRKRTAIDDPENTTFLSAVSATEIAIKYQLGKLFLPAEPGVFVPSLRVKHRIADLAFDERSALLLPTLPQHHRDPFDRMLICQALALGFTLVSSDPKIHLYPVPLL